MIRQIQQSNQFKYVHITGDKVICPEYMMQMVERSDCPSLLPVRYIKEDECIYDTLYGQSLESYISKKGYTPELLRDIIYEVNSMIKIVDSYLLDIGHIVLDWRYIYVMDRMKLKFVFNPYKKKDMQQQARTLVGKIIEGNFASQDIIDMCEDAEFSLESLINLLNNEEDLDSYSEAVVKKSVSLINIVDTKDTITVSDKDISVGRAYFVNTKKLPGRLASFRHAKIRYTQDCVYIKDLHSKNGTYINGEKITSGDYVKTGKGDVIAFADDEYLVL